MRCIEVAYQLQLYIDNRLTMEQVRALEAHVAGCITCQEELALLEEVTRSIHTLKLVAEPQDLTARIMQRIATTSSYRSTPHFSLLRLSLLELLTVVILATIASIGSILAQPPVRALLPFVNEHNAVSHTVMDALQALATININTLILACWVVGTLLGICITLVLAGNEMRSEWFKAVMERLPVR